MFNKFFLFVFVLGLNFTLNALAIGRVGNGGDILICTNAQCNKKSQFFDVYEAQARYDLAAQFPNVDISQQCMQSHQVFDGLYKINSCINDVQNIAVQLVERLAIYDADLVIQLKDFIKSFYLDSRFIADAELLPVNDVSTGFVPAGMGLYQLIIQQTPIVPEDRRYLISQDLFETLNPYHQAAAVVHEVLYRAVLVDRPATATSDLVRYFNALILSDKIKQMSLSDYQKIKRLVFYP